MNTYRVRFKFDHENSQSFLIEGESEEMVYLDILAKENWYTHTDDKGVFHSINLKLVTSIAIARFKRR